MALARLSSSSGNPGTGSPITFTYTNTAACVIVLQICTEGNSGGFVPISGITDSSGITWHRRSSTQYVSAFSGVSGNVNHITQEVWWANVTSINASAVTGTVTLTSTANQQTSTTWTWLTFTGSLVPATPWDVNVAVPNTATHSDVSTDTLPSVGWTISSTSAMVLAFLHQMNAAGTASVSTPGTGYADDTAHITIGNSTTGTLQVATEWIAGQSGSGTAAWAGGGASGAGTHEWILTADALTGTSTGTALPGGSSAGTISTGVTALRSNASGTVSNPVHVTGTVSTSLVVPRNGISGTVTGGAVSVTGTIATHLTKPGISAAAKEIFTGTATTALTKAGQSLSGHVTLFVGTITTRLTKASMSASGLETMTGTISTALTKVSQLAQAPGTVNGTVTTALSKAGLFANATEIITGTATTDIANTTHISTGVVANETFVGHIVTNLSGISFVVAAEERVIGSVAMRLGNESGQMVASVINAEVIILGPIVMALSPLRSILLAAKLGQPGAGKWYSWRYTDG